MKTQSYNLSVRFIANDNRADVKGLGASADFDAFPASYKNAQGKKVIPAGTVVSIGTDGLIPAKAATETAPGTGKAYLTVDTMVEGGNWAGAEQSALMRAGEVYENFLPQAVDGELPDELKTLLGELFEFSTHPGLGTVTPL